MLNYHRYRTEVRNVLNQNASPIAAKRLHSQRAHSIDNKHEDVRSVRSRPAQTPGQIGLYNDVFEMRAAHDGQTQDVAYKYLDHEGGSTLIIA